MNNIEIFANALDFIENNLQNDIRTQDVADACYCSKSALEKLFRHVNKLSVREYMVKRRMTMAARILVAEKDISVLEVALKFGYSTHESFTRAFQGVWGCNPSEIKSRKKIYELFPRLNAPIQNRGKYMEARRNLDISEMYDLFVQRKKCYFVCSDIQGLIGFNNVSRKLGDVAILESLNRLEQEAGEDDIVFRIGGDEFVMLTASEDKDYADTIRERILAKNGNPIQYEGTEYPLSLYVSTVKYEGSNIRYSELYEQLQTKILNTKYEW